jgi:hypothetical protein
MDKVILWILSRTGFIWILFWIFGHTHTMASRWAAAASFRWRQCVTAKTSVTNDATACYYSVAKSSAAAAHSFPLLGVPAAVTAAAVAAIVTSNSDNGPAGFSKECSNQRCKLINATWSNRVFMARNWGGLVSTSLPTPSFGRTLTRCDDSAVPQRQIPVKLQRKVRVYFTIVSRGFL